MWSPDTINHWRSWLKRRGLPSTDSDVGQLLSGTRPKVCRLLQAVKSSREPFGGGDAG